MKNVKFVTAFAVCGFVLSFIFGLFSHTAILSIFVKALIFGLVFFALGFGISFLFDKFLLEETSDDMDIDIPVQRNNSNSDTKGKLVDIVIKDEELPQSNSENHYLVGDNHQMLNENDYSKATPVSNTPQINDTDANVSFKPVKSLETLTNISSKESVHPDTIAPSNAPEKPASDGNFSDNAIDTLPDMTGFTIDKMSTVSDSSDDEDFDTDSGNDFETTAVRSSKSEAEVPEIKDASLYAKAISSILSSEDS